MDAVVRPVVFWPYSTSIYEEATTARKLDFIQLANGGWLNVSSERNLHAGIPVPCPRIGVPTRRCDSTKPVACPACSLKL